MNGLDLFSGIGGITIALRDWVKPVAYCESEPYCQAILLQRMQEGNLPSAPIWNDVRTLESRHLPYHIDIIYGGFPCQDISVAGRGKGLGGERSCLYWEIHRLAEEIKPEFVFIENVPAICTRGGWEVVSSLAEIGYDCRWTTLSAAEVGALHRRERWFLLAYSDGSRREEQCGTVSAQAQQPAVKCDGNNNGESSEQTHSCTISESSKGRAWGGYTGQYWPFESRTDWQEAVSNVCRGVDGVPNRVDRIKALGSAVVPQQAREAFKRLLAGCL